MKQCHQCGSAVRDEAATRAPSKGKLSKNLPPGSFPVADERNSFEENRDLQIKSVLLTVGILLITAILHAESCFICKTMAILLNYIETVMTVEKEISQWKRDVLNTVCYGYSKYGFNRS